jgi:hypothetical protein
MTYTEIKQAIAEGKTLVWDDPELIEGTDYTITSIDLNKEISYIKFDNGHSEGEVPNSEISLKKAIPESLSKALNWKDKYGKWPDGEPVNKADNRAHFIIQNNEIVMQSEDQISLPMFWHKITGKNFELNPMEECANYIEFTVQVSKAFVLVEGEIQLYENEKLIGTFELEKIS